MAPVLLDNRGLLKAGFSMLLALVVVFGGGFITGYQKAIVQQLALTQDRGIELPVVDAEQAEILAMVLAQPPVIEEAGASIDVDDPDNGLQETALKTVAKDGIVSPIIDDSTQVVARKQTQTSGLNSLTPLALSEENGATKKMAKSEIFSVSVEKSGKDGIAQTDVLQGNQSKPVKQTNVGSVLTQVSKLNARYSIQVGMYGQRVNASNLVTMLEAQGLAAYISEYLNKKQQLRYNVRFGYFESKRAALKGLKYYTVNMDGKGYLVRFKPTMHAENNRSATSVPTDKTAEF